MPAAIQEVLDLATKLPDSDRAKLAHGLLESLDSTDTHLDEIWAREANACVIAYDEGRMRGYSAEDVLRELEAE